MIYFLYIAAPFFFSFSFLGISFFIDLFVQSSWLCLLLQVPLLLLGFHLFQVWPVLLFSFSFSLILVEWWLFFWLALLWPVLLFSFSFSLILVGRWLFFWLALLFSFSVLLSIGFPVLY